MGRLPWQPDPADLERLYAQTLDFINAHPYIEADPDDITDQPIDHDGLSGDDDPGHGM